MRARDCNILYPCNPPGFLQVVKVVIKKVHFSEISLVDYRNYIGCPLNFMIYDIMVIGVENSSVSNLIVQNIHTYHISPSKLVERACSTLLRLYTSKHIYIQI